MNIAPMNRLKDCWPPTNQLGEEERSVSRGSTQAKCYGWLGKYIIRQKGINTITSIYLSETLIWINFNQNYCFGCTKSQGQYLVELEWHWHETILETIIKKHQPNSHHRNPDQLIFQILWCHPTQNSLQTQRLSFRTEKYPQSFLVELENWM